jgi:hypothetical protein
MGRGNIVRLGRRTAKGMVRYDLCGQRAAGSEPYPSRLKITDDI